MSLPIRILDLASFSGDAWAAPGSQTAPPESVPRCVAGGSGMVTWKIVPMSGIDSSAVAVDDAVTRIDACLLVLTSDPVTVARTSSLVDCKGEPQLTGALLVDKLDPGQRFVFAIPSVSAVLGPAAALWVFADTAGLI